MADSHYDLSQLNVLVVDDNKNMRALITSILFALGVREMVEAKDANEALVMLKSFPADLIITDWHMEPMDGVEFIRLVRNASDSPNPHVPIIMLTGHTQAQRVMEARDAGVNEFLAKPISAKALYQRIATIIERPRPFIRTKTYFGPCRRRKNVGPPVGKSERRAEELAKREAEADSADDVRELLRH